MNRLSYLLTFASFCLLLGCNQPPSALEQFFLEMDQALTATEKEELISCENTECVYSFILRNSKHPKLAQLFKNPSYELTALLKNKQIEDQYFWVVLAYQKERSQQPYTTESIESEIALYKQLKEQTNHGLAVSRHHEMIDTARSIYQRTAVDQTLNLIFPVVSQDQNCVVEFRPYTAKDQVIYLKCNVLSKKKVPASEESDFDHPHFLLHLEVVETSQSCRYFELDSIDRESQFDLELYEYSRLIINR